MSLTGALNAALSGLKVSTTAVQVISSNVANAQTPGYAAQTVNITEVITGGSSNGAVISGYSQVTDDVLSATLNNATSSAAFYSTQNSYLSQVQSILDSSSSTPALTSTLSAFQSALSTYAASTDSTTSQASLVTAGQNLTNAINTIASRIGTLQSAAQANLATNVSTLNTDLQKVQLLNTQIQAANANNQSPNELIDQRNQAVNAIAAITNVQSVSRNGGTIALYTPGGTLLLDGQAQTFSVSGNKVVNAIGADVSDSLSGGSLQAQVQFLSTDTTNTGNGVAVLSKLTGQLQGLVGLFTSTTSSTSFASTYNNATTASGELGSNFFTATTDSSGNVDLSSFAVNAALVNRTSVPKAAAANSLSGLFTTTNASFSAGGLTTTNQTYSGITNSILSYFQQAANTISSSASTSASQQTYYKNALSSEIGVNTDSELVNLTNWQNSYAASAHVISTIKQMFTTLENMVS